MSDGGRECESFWSIRFLDTQSEFKTIHAKNILYYSTSKRVMAYKTFAWWPKCEQSDITFLH